MKKKKTEKEKFLQVWIEHVLVAHNELRQFHVAPQHPRRRAIHPQIDSTVISPWAVVHSRSARVLTFPESGENAQRYQRQSARKQSPRPTVSPPLLLTDTKIVVAVARVPGDSMYILLVQFSVCLVCSCVIWRGWRLPRGPSCWPTNMTKKRVLVSSSIPGTFFIIFKQGKLSDLGFCQAESQRRAKRPRTGKLPWDWLDGVTVKFRWTLEKQKKKKKKD